MVTGAPWGMRMTDAGLLKLTQWLSPAFPLGSYAYSHGLETAITKGDVHDAASLTAWVQDILQFGAGQADAILLIAALRKTHPAGELADHAAALAASRERWQESLDQGTAFAAAVSSVEDRAMPALPLPVAVGIAAANLELAAEQVAALYLHAFAANLVSAAVRFVPLGQNDGQRVLADLHPVILCVAELAASSGLSDIASATFGGDMTAMLHETQDVRIFKT